MPLYLSILGKALEALEMTQVISQRRVVLASKWSIRYQEDLFWLPWRWCRNTEDYLGGGQEIRPLPVCPWNLPNMPALCSMLVGTYYATIYAGTIDSGLNIHVYTVCTTMSNSHTYMHKHLHSKYLLQCTYTLNLLVETVHTVHNTANTCMLWPWQFCYTIHHMLWTERITVGQLPIWCFPKLH